MIVAIYKSTVQHAHVIYSSKMIKKYYKFLKKSLFAMVITIMIINYFFGVNTVFCTFDWVVRYLQGEYRLQNTKILIAHGKKSHQISISTVGGSTLLPYACSVFSQSFKICTPIFETLCHLKRTLADLWCTYTAEYLTTKHKTSNFKGQGDYMYFMITRSRSEAAQHKVRLGFWKMHS